MLIVFFLFWILLNGQWTTEIALVGLVLSVLLYLFVWKFMDYSPKKEWALFRRVPRILGYLTYLVGEIFKSAWQTIRFIWSPGVEVEPQLVSFRSRLHTDAGRVVLANSITMTPGTITADIQGDKLLVHALDASFAQGLEGSEMEQRIMKLEGESHHA